MNDSDYILEYITQGRFMKLSVIDPETGIEAVIVGSINDSRELLKREALRKMEYLLAKEKKLPTP